MARYYYVGWFLRETLAHCNDINGNTLCSRVSKSYATTGWPGEDCCRYENTRQYGIDHGWRLCPSCNSRKNQEAIERVELAIEEYRISEAQRRQ